MKKAPGTSTSDSIPRMLSDGEYVLQASAVDRIGLSALDALNTGQALPATAAAPASAAQAVARAPRAMVINHNVTIEGAMDPTAVAQQMERVLLKLQRTYGLPTGVLSR